MSTSQTAMEQFGSAKAAFLKRAGKATVSDGFLVDVQSLDQELVGLVF